jgi:hypothetical protein
VLHAKSEVVHELTLVVFGNDLHFHDAIRSEQHLSNLGGKVQYVCSLIEVEMAFFEHPPPPIEFV